MSMEFSFAGLVPSKEETLKNYSNIKKESEKLAILLDNLKTRLSKGQVRIDDFDEKEKGLVRQLQKALAENGDAKEIRNTLDKTRKDTENGRLEIEGLKDLIVEKEQELKEIKKQIALKDYYMALSNLHPLFDLYNKQAAELAETIKKIFFESITCEEEAKRSGSVMVSPVNFTSNRGIPEEIPAIVPDYSKATNTERFHWNYFHFRQEYAKTR